MRLHRSGIVATALLIEEHAITNLGTGYVFQNFHHRDYSGMKDPDISVKEHLSERLAHKIMSLKHRWNGLLFPQGALIPLK